MNPKLRYSSIGLYRTELMGLAILLVYVFHSRLYFPTSVLFAPLGFLKNIGYGGVDIFFLLSGFGLVTGYLQKNPSLSQFYSRRAQRIIPTYWIILTFFFLKEFFFNSKVNVLEILLGFSTIGFWINWEIFDWYVPSIIGIYLIFPFLFKIYNRFQSKTFGSFLLIVLALMLSLFLIVFEKNYLLIISTRIPVFILGMHAGYLALTNDRPFKNSYIILASLSLIISLVTLSWILEHFTKDEKWQYGLWWYPFILGTLPFCLLFTKVMQTNIFPAFLNLYPLVRHFLIFTGSLSFEIYLIHLELFKLSDSFDYLIPEAFNKGRILTYTSIFLITIFLAFCLQRLSNSIMLKFQSPKFP